MKKSILKKVFTVIVTMAMFTMFSQPMIEAATTRFISEVVLVYGKDLEEAKGKLDGAGYDILPKNLNDGTSKFNVDSPDVYLAYKTSTDVEDAVTDFAVMDMNGGYKEANYKEQLERSLEEYKAMAADYRIAAAEFKKNYDGGRVMAQAAYKQMNFYKDDDTDLLMGDFMMNIPSDDALATVLMQGNIKIVQNLSALLAMGVAGTDGDTLVSRIDKCSQTPENYNDPSYYETAKIIASKFEVIADKMIEYENAEQSGEFEENCIGYINASAIYENIKNVKYRNTTLLEFVKAKNWEPEDFYPMVAAMTDGQRALARLGYSGNLFIYNTTTKTAKEFEDLLEEQKEKYPDAMSVYFGIDRTIFEGDFAFTTDALRNQADTGDSFWNTIKVTDLTVSSLIVFGIGTAATIFSLKKAVGYSAKAKVALRTYMRADMDMYHIYKDLELYKLDTAERIYLTRDVDLEVETVQEYVQRNNLKMFDKNALDIIDNDPLTSPDYSKAYDEVAKTKMWSNIWGIAAGVGMLVMAISAGYEVWDYYHPEYKAVPDTLIDVIETDNGDHYVKYDAVMNIEPQERKLDDGTKVQEIVPGDLNGFFGKQWNALYVTKDFTAGKPLTATKINYSNDTDTPAKGYAPVHYFGEEVAYNLNNHHYSSSKNIFLSFKQSNEKKAAEASVPDPIATNLSYGISAITGGGGIAVGMVIMGFIKRKKKKDEQ